MIKTINIVYQDFPTCRADAIVRENPDDSYTILVNSRLNYERQQEAIRHELAHINNDDIDSTMSADEIEKMRNEEE